MSGKKEENPRQPEVSTDKIHLTDAGERLLEVLKVPEFRIQTVTSICERAEISRDSYYRLFRSPDFIQKYLELCKNTLLSFAMPASLALGRQAELGDVSAIKMVLEMSGVYQPKATVDVNHTYDAGPTLRDLLTHYRSRNQQKELEGSAE